MADLKPLQILLLMAPLLLASQANSTYAHADTGDSNLPKQSSFGGLSSTETYRPQPQNSTNAASDELDVKIALRRFRSRGKSMRRRRRRERQRAHRNSGGFIPAVSLPNICFAIHSSILHNLVSVNSY